MGWRMNEVLNDLVAILIACNTCVGLIFCICTLHTMYLFQTNGGLKVDIIKMGHETLLYVQLELCLAKVTRWTRSKQTIATIGLYHMSKLNP